MPLACSDNAKSLLTPESAGTNSTTRMRQHQRAHRPPPSAVTAGTLSASTLGKLKAPASLPQTVLFSFDHTTVACQISRFRQSMM